MAHITLYKPDSVVPEEYDNVSSYDVKDGVLTFVAQKDASLLPVARITTSVPFLVRHEMDTTR
jgi:hypothetical protein